MDTKLKMTKTSVTSNNSEVVLAIFLLAFINYIVYCGTMSAEEIIQQREIMEYGYFSYKYNAKKCKALEEYLVKNDYYLTDGASEEIFIVKDGYEKEVLNELMEKYPAENYASKEFEQVLGQL